MFKIYNKINRKWLLAIRLILDVSNEVMDVTVELDVVEVAVFGSTDWEVAEEPDAIVSVVAGVLEEMDVVVVDGLVGVVGVDDESHCSEHGQMWGIGWDEITPPLESINNKTLIIFRICEKAWPSGNNKLSTLPDLVFSLTSTYKYQRIFLD